MSIPVPADPGVPMPSASSVRAGQLAAASLFGALGFGYGTWPSRLPAIKANLGLSTSQVSVVLLAAAIGSILSFPVTAAALHKLGSRGASLLSGCLLAAGLVTLGLAPNWTLACIVMGVYGVIASTMDVAMNAQGVEVERATGAAVMSRLHGAFSLGTFAGAFFAFAIMNFSTSVPLHFVIAALIVLAITPYTPITMHASVQFGARPSATSPAASRHPDSRLAPREPSLCSAAAVTGNDRMDPIAAASSKTLTCEVLKPRLPLIAGSRDVHVP